VPLHNLKYAQHTFYLPKGYKRIKSIYAILSKEQMNWLQSEEHEDQTGMSDIEISVGGIDVVKIPINLIIVNATQNTRKLDINELTLNYPVANGKILINYYLQETIYLVFTLDNVEEYDCFSYEFEEYTTINDFFGLMVTPGGEIVPSNYKDPTINIVRNKTIESVFFNVIRYFKQITEDVFNERGTVLKALSESKTQIICDSNVYETNIFFHTLWSNIPVKKIMPININSQSVSIITVSALKNEVLYDNFDYKIQIILKLKTPHNAK